VAQLSGGNGDCIKRLMDLQVPCLGLMEDLANVVHRALDCSDPPREGARLSPWAQAPRDASPLDLKGPLRSRTL
jgi:hypothetical protein